LYTATFNLTDEFGNVYPPQTSATPLVMVVSVSPSKLSLQSQAHTFAIAALGLALFAVFLYFFNTVAAAIAAAAAGAMLGLSIWHGAMALDPGVPDFDYSVTVAITVPESFSIPAEAERPSLLALRALIELLNRGRAAYEAMGVIHKKAMGAYVDAAADSLRSQLTDYRRALGMLQRIANLLPDTVAEAERALIEDQAYDPDRFREMLESWRREGDLPDNIREVWQTAQLPEEGLQQLEALIRHVDTFPDLPTVILRRISSAFSDFVHAVDAESREVLNLEERS
jgi:hypothetical protein